MRGVASQPREWALFTILPKNTAINKEWFKNIFQEQLLPTIQEQFGLYDGAPFHKAKVITKWLGEQNINILCPWPGNSPDRNPIKDGRTNTTPQIQTNFKH